MTILSVTIQILSEVNDDDNGLRTYLDIAANEMCHELEKQIRSDEKYKDATIQICGDPIEKETI